MKIKKLLLVGLLATIGTNAFAIDVKSSGIIYNQASASATTVTVKNISYGMSAASAKTITIPGSIIDGEGNTLKVTGFEANWYNGTDVEGGTRTITATTETLNVDMTNFTASLDANVFGAITSLTKVVLSGTNATTNISVKALSDAANPTVKTLDLSKLAGKEKVTIDGADASLESISMPAQATEIGASVFGATNIGSIDLSYVTKIGINAFYGCDGTPTAKFTALTIPASIVKGGISAGAFGNMSNLETVTITNNNLEKVDAWFNLSTAIKSISITSTSINEIAANVFSGVSADFKAIDLSGCTALKTVAANSFKQNAYTSVKLKGSAIDDTNFARAKNWWANATASLNEFTFPEAVTEIPANTFADFDELTSIGLPKGLKEIGNNAFDDCDKLAKITFKGYLETIGDAAFYSCDKLAAADFSLATELKTIGVSAFEDTKLTALDLSACTKLEKIDASAFAGTTITSLDLSACEKLKSVDATAFPANEYKSVKLSGTSLAYWDETVDPALYVDHFTVPFQTILANSKKSLTEITLPSALTSIGNNLFKGFTALTSVSLPKAVQTIGVSAFEGSGLTAFKVRENVATIGNAAFKDCKALATINFSEAAALTTIGAMAFQNCEAFASLDLSASEKLATIGGSAFRATAIKEANLPASVTTILGWAFADCKKLKSFSAKGLTGTLANDLFNGDVKLTGIVIPTGIDGIGAEAFKGCETLATVTFKFGDDDDALATNGIGANAFEGCAALASLDLSTTKLTNLDNNNIFKGCTSLATITFPEDLTSLLGSDLFADCPIETLDAANVHQVSNTLFGTYWDKKTKAYAARNAKNTNTTLKSVTIGGDIPAGAFAYCTALETVEYFDNAHYGFVNTASDVQANAFAYCTALTTFTYMPEAVLNAQTIDYKAFMGCTPYILLATNQAFIDATPMAPLNTSYDGSTITATTVKTVQDKANANQFFAKFYNPTTSVNFKADDCKVYTVYVDDETVYYQACRTVEGFYNIPANRPVIIKTDAAKEVKFKLGFAPGTGTSSVGWDDMYCSKEGDGLADVQLGVNPNYGGIPLGLQAGEYLYRLTNTEGQGFGFTHFTGTTVKPGQFFIACSKIPAASGRLTEVWLDEDGNVEGTTAIQGVKKTLEQNDGAIYNLQGVRVQKAQKGLYIQNGKKIFVK